MMRAMRARTFVIGDIHGDLASLERLLGRLPELGEGDTVVFLGDYVDRGPDSRGVVERVRRFQAEAPCKVVALRGNHEDKWIACYHHAEPGFMLPPGNGCAQMFRSFTGGAPLAPDESLSPEEFARFFETKAWIPADVAAWMESLPLFYEDEHAIYVHAGLDGEGTEWKHPSEGRPKQLLWMREPDFFANYQGKTVVFGHTVTHELPDVHVGHLGRVAKFFDDPNDVWVRGDLFGIDTGCGKGGFLSALELPRKKVYESR